MHGLNLDHLRTFSEAIASGSFSKAAIRLGLTQPAVSLQIRNLERRLGVRLIERAGKRALPTAAGRDLLALGRRLQEDAEAAIAHMQGYARGQLGRVRIGTGATACIYLLPELLASLREAHPDLEIAVVTGNTSEMLDAVESDALDLALVTLPAKRRALLIREVFADPLVAVFSSSSRVPREALRPRYFRDQRLILYSRGGTIRTVIDEWFAAAGVAAKPALELESVEATKSFVAAGLGCSILPSIAVADGRRGRGLLVRALAPALSRKLGLALRQNKVRDTALRAAIQAFERLARR